MQLRQHRKWVELPLLYKGKVCLPGVVRRCVCVRAGNACLIEQGLHRKALELLAMRLEVRAVSATLTGRGVVRNAHGRLCVVCATECGDRRSSSQAIGSARGVPEGEELARGVVAGAKLSVFTPRMWAWSSM